MPACNSCGAAIRWATGAKSGKPIPLDVAPVVAGNIELRGETAHYVTPDHNAIGQRFVSHFATCPQAAQHRKGK